VVDWAFKDNLFDQSQLAHLSEDLAHENNAYYQSANFYTYYPTNGSEFILTNVTYQSGPMGDHYQPTSSMLINAGSLTNAAQAGLYHFTTTTNQVKEGFGHLDIGIHYVAVDTLTGLPLDQDGDGLPDYLEDWNGNGQVDTGETDWDGYNTLLGVGSGPGLRVFTPLE
jgi:hypothetical protein